MLICIKGGANEPMWRIPLPFFFFCNLLVKEKYVKKILHWTAEWDEAETDEDMQALQTFVSSIDYPALRQTLQELKKYRGLKLVDITSAKGEIVRITI